MMRKIEHYLEIKYFVGILIQEETRICNILLLQFSLLN